MVSLIPLSMMKQEPPTNMIFLKSPVSEWLELGKTFQEDQTLTEPPLPIKPPPCLRQIWRKLPEKYPKRKYRYNFLRLW